MEMSTVRRRTWFLALLTLAVAAPAALGAPVHAASVTLDRVLAAGDWLNAKPSTQSVRGKVVVLDFYTFECFNCKNTEPNLRALYRERPRADLVILSVHSPETSIEKNRDNLIASLKEQGIVWPVAVDNDFAIWNAYGIQAWPTQMIFDRSGQLRKTVVGDSQDDAVDATVDQLIREK
jgi:thiol-disulfide isomerase/thioredoxin